MFIIPAVDIKNGKCVQLVQGIPGTEQVVIENPEIVAKDWENKGASILHVINLDGAFGNKSKNLEVVEKILDTVSIPVQLGGGIRTVQDAMDLLDIGVEKVILGTMAVENPETVEELSNKYGSNRILVALDSKDSKVVIKGWMEKTEKNASELGVSLQKKGAGGILFTNVDVEGMMSGFDMDPLLELLNAVDIPVIYSGGVTSLMDIENLSKTKTFGVVIGSALYKGKIDFIDALKYQKIL
ncbi:1-(5-phosphoribosyl)-5-[(5-phosphoribosylamino)methylideneamino]imidazole-4-carboxamide isomerase [Methanobacterium spitsbergense]|uniref:1-(5-phosphoribosyl)-5-[(5-phosphoribosylamino)methylideneamino] imidazole-4-carboxamide isomerase n=1 Tax=Methanobacterium spitsbergense TaxID=2874285 RepID=A0A8T5UYJ7_9EURY|nr:1-(5-phosphoribosyl)-5-[(5-phosphoribosylamino)methylideneamino]imidazole-4-carboxamide isomerase [Methanobacterium spitsbergense]MBZ2165799.1 1-(5-phosphoribosyl)-5-[(5-phosphoribosylamino)methylideneamino]imidazole-4-carboxamide isomerase [Methanobacterium spitsbergense]